MLGGTVLPHFRTSVSFGPLVRVAVGAAAISTAAVFVKVASQGGVGTSAIGAWRCLIGACVLFPLAASLGALRRPPLRILILCMLAGIAFAADLFVWHRAIVLVGAGMATILANTQVFWTTLFGALIYRAPIPRGFMSAATLAFLGVVLLIGVGSDIELSPSYAQGILFGLLTGLAYAGYVLSIRRAAVLQAETRNLQDVPSIAQSMAVLAWASLVTGVLLAMASALEGERLFPEDLGTWASLAGLALVPQVIGWIAIAGGLSQLAPAQGALVLLVQPVLATVWGVLLFSERLSVVQLVGAALTLAAIYKGSRIKT